MRTHQCRAPRTPSTRGGFTFVELLVVITILATLMGLIVAGIFTTVESQRQSNTEVAMRTAMQTLDKHWKFVVDQASKESPSAAAKVLAGGTPPFGDDANLQRAQAIWIKLRLMEAFPVCYAEINDPSAGGVPRVYQNTPFPPNTPWIPMDAT